MHPTRLVYLLGASIWLVFTVTACAPALRLRNPEPASLADMGFTRYEVTVGDTLNYNVLNLKNGGATLYQALAADGDLWVNTYRISVSSNAGGASPVTLASGNLLSNSARSLFQRGNRYVWDIGTSVSNSFNLD